MRTYQELIDVMDDLGVFDGNMTKRERQAFPDMLRHWIASSRRFRLSVSVSQSLMNGGVMLILFEIIQKLH